MAWWCYGSPRRAPVPSLFVSNIWGTSRRKAGRSLAAAGVASFLLLGATAPVASAGADGNGSNATTRVIVISREKDNKDKARGKVNAHHGKVQDDLSLVDG